jgi:flagellar protein FlgJ
MLETQDISSRFALDAQSVGKLRLQAKQDPDAALKAVAQQFESIFMNMMLKSMREATPKDGMLDSEQGNLYTQLFDQQLAQKLTAGKGLGVADMLVKQLTRSGLTTSAESQVLSPESKISPESSVLSPKSGQVVSAPSVPYSVAATQHSALSTQDSAFKTPKDFVNKLWPHAVEAGKSLGIPPHFLLGQAALESGWGKRQILDADGKNSHNLFGIKAGAKWGGETAVAATTEYGNGGTQATREPFRAYASYADSFRDYATMLRNNPRYQGVLGQGADAASFAQALQQSGYATDPQYASKLARVVGSETMRQALQAG